MTAPARHAKRIRRRRSRFSSPTVQAIHRPAGLPVQYFCGQRPSRTQRWPCHADQLFNLPSHSSIRYTNRCHEPAPCCAVRWGKHDAPLSRAMQSSLFIEAPVNGNCHRPL
jgi:hypothetical protein